MQKHKYIKLFKEHPKLGDAFPNDAKIRYFMECRDKLNLALPILEKINNKTLVLQNYTLSEGHCIGLA